MMKEEELIQAYIHGTLDESAIVAFENEIALDSDLKVQVDDYRVLHQSIVEAERQELKSRLKKITNKEDAPQDENKSELVRKLRPYFLPLVAASIICIAVLNKGYFFSSGINSSSLYEEYYTSYPNTLQPITRSDQDPNATIKAFIAYEAGDFKKAERLFKEILDQKTDSDIKFYYSMSLINLGREDKALTLFNELKRDSTLYIPQTYWYAALLELKNGNTKKSIELIDSLQVIDPDFKTKEIIQLKKQLE